MKTLIYITIITILLIIPSVFPLTAGEITALTDMQNEWGSTLAWPGNSSNACDASPNGWTGILCVNETVIEMFVKLFVNLN